MENKLCSVGLDVGTTTTQLILSQLTVENRGGVCTVPDMQITGRKILYRSPVYFTPLSGHDRVDGEGLRELIRREYARAGICREAVDTGAIIITGETSRRENAATVVKALADFAGDFVVATAGPDLESLLAARGSGAAEYAEKTGERVLHMDIGGGTSNLALLRGGTVLRTGCLNIGGRLIRLEPDGKIGYVSPVLAGYFPYGVGETPPENTLYQLARTLCAVLETAAGRAEGEIPAAFQTAEAAQKWEIPREEVTVSLSGGVADCIDAPHSPLEFGDIGVLLGRAIRESSLCRGKFRLGRETIRATVIGAGCHSTQLSGSTVFCRKAALPIKNLPAVCFSRQEQESPSLPALISRRLSGTDGGQAVLCFPGYSSPSHRQVAALAQQIAAGVDTRPVLVCVEGDMAKALGQQLCLHTPADTPILCLDGLRLGPQSYLDVGQAVGPCYPVVIKTLVLEKSGTGNSLY